MFAVWVASHVGHYVQESTLEGQVLQLVGHGEWADPWDFFQWPWFVSFPYYIRGIACLFFLGGGGAFISLYSRYVCLHIFIYFSNATYDRVSVVGIRG
jgi:hypothetical protein